jgi:hypothetical protein
VKSKVTDISYRRYDKEKSLSQLILKKGLKTPLNFTLSPRRQERSKTFKAEQISPDVDMTRGSHRHD